MKITYFFEVPQRNLHFYVPLFGLRVQSPALESAISGLPEGTKKQPNNNSAQTAKTIPRNNKSKARTKERRQYKFVSLLTFAGTKQSQHHGQKKQHNKAPHSKTTPTKASGPTLVPRMGPNSDHLEPFRWNHLKEWIVFVASQSGAKQWNEEGIQFVASNDNLKQ